MKQLVSTLRNVETNKPKNSTVKMYVNNSIRLFGFVVVVGWVCYCFVGTRTHYVVKVGLKLKIKC